jgi:Ser/Thr protein kinase RdoA (MazF antagonist)
LLHRDAADGGLPEAFGGPRGAAAADYPDDPELGHAAARVWGALGGLPRDSRVFGVVHGDFELDNLAWVGDRATAFDFDEAARGWFIADIGSALRDLGGAAFEQSTGRAFLAGYCAVRQISDAEIGWLPLFGVAQNIGLLIRLRRALDMQPAAGDPAWLARLYRRLRERARSLRTEVLASPLVRG